MHLISASSFSFHFSRSGHIPFTTSSFLRCAFFLLSSYYRQQVCFFPGFYCKIILPPGWCIILLDGKGQAGFPLFLVSLAHKHKNFSFNFFHSACLNTVYALISHRTSTLISIMSARSFSFYFFSSITSLFCASRIYVCDSG